MRSTGIVCIAALLAVSGGVARAERVVLGEVQSEAELADEANAVVLLIRTALTKDDQLVLAPISAATPAELAKLSVDHGVFLDVAHEGTGLGVTIAIANRAGGVAITHVHAGDGDVYKLATGVVDHVVAATRIEFRPVPVVSFGALRPYAEAMRVVHEPAAALAALADANPATALAVTAIAPALHVLTNTGTPAARMFVARAIGARDVIDAFLASDPKDAASIQVAAVARTFVAVDHTEVEKADAALGKATGGEANLARVLIADQRNDRPRMNTLLADALKGDTQREALALASTLPFSHLTPALQQTLLGLAERQQATSPAIAGRIGLEAAALNVEVARSLALIEPRELDQFQLARLAKLLATLKEPVPKSTIARLEAELAMQRADGTDVAAIDAYLTAAPSEPRARLYKAYLATPIKPLPPSKPDPVVQAPTTGSAVRPPVTAPVTAPEADSESLLTLPVIAGIAGGVVLLGIVGVIFAMRRRRLPRAATAPAPAKPSGLVRLRVIVEADPPHGIGIWTTDRRKRVLTDAAGEATIELSIGNHEVRFDCNGEVFTRSVAVGTQSSQRFAVDLRRNTGLAKPADVPVAKPVEVRPDPASLRLELIDTVPVTNDSGAVLAHADTASIDIPLEGHSDEPAVEVVEPEPEPEPERPVAKRASMFEIANPGTVPGHMPASMRTPAPKLEAVKPPAGTPTPTIKHTAPPPTDNTIVGAPAIKSTAPLPTDTTIVGAPQIRVEPAKPEAVKAAAKPEVPKPEAAKAVAPKADPVKATGPTPKLDSSRSSGSMPKLDAPSAPKVDPTGPTPKVDPKAAAKLESKPTGPTPKVEPAKPISGATPKLDPAKATGATPKLDPTRASGAMPKLDPSKATGPTSKLDPAKATGPTPKLDVELDPGPFGATAPQATAKRPAPVAAKPGARVKRIDTPMEFELSAAGAQPMALESEMPVAPDLELAPSEAPPRPKQWDTGTLPPVMDFELDEAPSASPVSESGDTRVKPRNDDTSTTAVHEPAPPDPSAPDVSEPIEPPAPVVARSRTESGEIEDLPGDPTAITTMDMPDESAPLADDPTAITSGLVEAQDDDDDGRETTAVSAKHQVPAPFRAAAIAAATAQPLQDPAPRPVGPPRLGRYLRFNEVARGPGNTVFRGYDERQKRDVGIEALPPVLDPIASASLVTSLSKLEHANLVRVYELIVHAGKPYLITEPLAGKSLAQHILDRGVYPWLEAVGLMDEICAGLEYAHERSILHRALCPSVIVLQSKTAKLGGFAIAPDLGNPVYVAPEVLAGGRSDRRSDIYSVGATLFEALTGRPPGADHELAGVPLKLQHLVDAMLAKNPADRPATVKEVRSSFKGLVDF